MTNVKKYIIIPGGSIRWVVVGKNRDYIVSDDYCSCKNFLLHIGDECKHIRAMKEARKNGDYDTFELTFEEYDPIRKEFLDIKH
ncbi:MAG: SWIM zinc finger family protein [Candidatus Hodarchaeales archaeon]